MMLTFECWIGTIFQLFKQLDQEMMFYIQSLFILLWTIWNHINKVVHDGINPNPMEVILTAQCLTCRYQDAFSKNQDPDRVKDHQALSCGNGSNWQLIIKVVGARRKMSNRGGYAYESTTLQGNIIFTGGASCAAISVHGAIQEAIVEALLKATSLGYK